MYTWPSLYYFLRSLLIKIIVYSETKILDKIQYIYIYHDQKLFVKRSHIVKILMLNISKCTVLGIVHIQGVANLLIATDTR